jgi:hypothetical protein
MKKVPFWKRVVYDTPESPFHVGSTYSLSSPKNSNRGCLCKHKNIYSKKCCDGRLPSQGIGITFASGSL